MGFRVCQRCFTDGRWSCTDLSFWAAEGGSLLLILTRLRLLQGGIEEDSLSIDEALHRGIDLYHQVRDRNPCTSSAPGTSYRAAWFETTLPHDFRSILLL